MFEKIIQLTGKKKGLTSIILAGVHGNEKCGVIALKKILPNLKIEKGRVFVGFGNPRALKTNKRFTEANLNRMFKKNSLLSKKEKESYEYKRAQFLKKYLRKADALLDLHATTTTNSKPFVICEKNSKKIVKYLPVRLVVSGFNKVEPGGTDYYLNNLGKIGICVECGYNQDPKSVKVAQKNILAFLKARGHLVNNLQPKKQKHIRMYSLYLTKTNNFTLAKSFVNFEKITKGQLVGLDGTKKVRAKKNSIILFACNRKKSNEEAFLLGKKERAWF